MKDLFLKTRTADFAPRPNEILLGSQGNALIVVVASFTMASLEDMSKSLAGTLEDYFKIESITPSSVAWVIKLNSQGPNSAGERAKSILKAAVKNWLNRKDIKVSVKPNRHKNIFCTIDLSGGDMPEPQAEVVLPAAQEYNEYDEPADPSGKLTSNIQVKIRGLVKLRAMLETEEAVISKSELENELAERAARGSILSEVPSME